MARISAAIAAGLLLLALWFLRRETPAPAEAQAAVARSESSPWEATLRGTPPERRAPPRARPGVTIPWGNGEGALGRSTANESSPEAPMSLAMTQRGEALILDQVNGRIARFDAAGAPLSPFPMALRAPRDLASGPRGEIAVLDPGAGSVALFAADGAPRGAVHIEDAARATGVTMEESGVWVETDHAWEVRVADGEGRPLEAREKRDGRASRDGTALLSAGIAEAAAGTAWVRALDAATGAFRWQRRYAFAAPILRLALLDSFADGRIAFAAHVARETAPGKFADESIQILCLTAKGELSDTISLGAPEGPEEASRELAAGPDGTIAYLYRTRPEARLLRVRCGS